MDPCPDLQKRADGTVHDAQNRNRDTVHLEGKCVLPSVRTPVRYRGRDDVCVREL
jgi:hypothetical protein